MTRTRFFRLVRHTLAVLLIGALIAISAPGMPSAAMPWPQGPLGQVPTPVAQTLGSETLAQLAGVTVPPRDRIDLAQRLLGLSEVPQLPTTAPPELDLGAVVTFWADNLDDDYAFQVDAELVYKTAHVYMFVEVGQPVDLAAVQRSADAFEEVIRPRVHQVFGTEWTPGIDGDPHLVVLHATRLGQWVAAYYGSNSAYPAAAVANSNEREMFYVNLDTMGESIGTWYYEGVLAHEFQHMVHWHVDPNEDTWLNEGLSELATLITGYGPGDFTWAFLQSPEIQLNTWPEESGQRGLHYGAAFLFAAYFYQRYGEEATTTLVRNPASGLASVDQALAAIGAADPTTGAPVTVVDLFADWLAANLLADPTLYDGRYAYTLADMDMLPPATVSGTLPADGLPREAAAPQWGAHYLVVPGGSVLQRFRLTFSGSESVSIVPTNAHSGRAMWWSNRADDSDSRLTRAFDLSGVSAATLRFWTWYQVETLWDFAYVMVSTDDGASWTPLSTRRTTTDDPHHNAYGPAYTGASGGWVEEMVDLSPYAGREILLRFEVITDDAVTQPGMVLDDIRIPEIGYADDVESDEGGWISEGWLRTDNRFPQDFLVLLIQPPATADANPVRRLLDLGDGSSGEWEFTAGGAAGDAVLVVSGLAPITTEPARYTVTLSPITE
ncbi:MAG: immune inhibitor A [Anaerolineae bacterium]|nr:immune inhibitor A [Anaerolineae bacterium]